ncbi:MAG: HAMP domain-containing histidine kinase [Lachnospiraceae bacterium]|nr:HAMP domain-containing histidine kinase [Lachnospiraceae bacterium]
MKTNNYQSIRLKMLWYALISIILAIISMVIVMFIGLHIREKILMDSIYEDHIFESEHFKEILKKPFLSEKMYMDVVFLFGFVIIFFALYYLLISRKMVDGLRNISKAVEKIKEGNFEIELGLEGNDEVTALAQSVSEMSEEIKAMMVNQKRLEQEKDDLITSVAHDLRTPLTSILGYLDLILDNHEISAEEKLKYLTIVNKKSMQLKKLIEELFDYTKYSKNQMVPKKMKLDITKFMEQIVEEFYPSFYENQIEVSTNFPTKSIFIDADGDLLARAIGNILNNAVKYGADGKQIIISMKEVKSKIKISIINFGQIIPEEDIDKIFDRFFRVEQSRSEKTGGTGLGLAIAKSIFELHEANVEVTSGEEGTEFLITFHKREERKDIKVERNE